MKVTVVYALPDRQIVRDLEVLPDATLAVALEQSGLLREFPEINLASAPVGVHGRLMPRSAVLQPGDRVEIYRQLNLEPAEARRRRFSKR